MRQRLNQREGLYRYPSLLSWPISVGSEPEILFCLMYLPAHAVYALLALLPMPCSAQQPPAIGVCSLTELQDCARALAGSGAVQSRKLAQLADLSWQQA